MLRPLLCSASWFLRWVLALLATVVSLATSAIGDVADYEYLCPVPDSRMIRTTNNVIVRYGEPINAATLTPGVLTVVGYLSGLHTGALELSDDGETIVFTPSTPYQNGEGVVVILSAGIKTVGNADLPSFSYEFFVTSQTIYQPPPRVWPLNEEIPPGVAMESPYAATPARMQAGPCDLPAGYPAVTLLQSNDPAPGFTFLGPFGAATPGRGHLMILDDRANPLFWRVLPWLLLDFKPTPDGRTGYIGPAFVHILDSTYTVVDSFTTGNGYTIDPHDFQILPNGHVLVMSYDKQRVGMDTVVVGGRPDAVVIGFVVQELDLARRVVFQWRSWEEIPITDMVSPGESLTDSLIDYIHGNAVELDQDGNLLISSRHINEITKIDRRTGRILWRFGGNSPQNQFTISNDPRGFSHQHDIRRLANGNISLFDNGNFLTPPYSRGLEYEIDEVAKTANLVWEYRNSPDTYGPFMGNVQLLSGGGHMVGWGGTSGTNPRLTEIHSDESTAFELTLPPNTWTYRAYKSPWSTTLIMPSQDLVDFGTVDRSDPPHTISLFLHNRSDRPFTFNCVTTTHPAFTADHVLPFTLDPGDSTALDVTFNHNYPGSFDERLYVRSVSDSQIIGTVVRVRAETNPTVGVGSGPLAFVLYQARPNPFRSTTMFHFDLPRPAHVALEVFDIHGRRVATAIDGMRAAGRHEFVWDAPGLADGVYVCRLRAGGLEATRKLARVR